MRSFASHLVLLARGPARFDCSQTAALLALVGLALLAGCSSDADSCANNIRIAATVSVEAPDDVTVDKVTIEQVSEELCGTVRAPTGAKVYQCSEQDGGGTYVVRAYSGGRIWTSTEELESDGCHIKQRAELIFDLSLDP